MASKKATQVDEVPTHRGEFEYKLRGFSVLDKRPGDKISIHPFSLCGELWEGVLYPAGTLGMKESFQFSIGHVSENTIRAEISVAVIDRYNQRTKLPRQYPPDKFRTGDFRTYTLQLSEVRSKYLLGDTLTIIFDIKVIGDLTQTSTPLPSQVLAPATKSLSQCIKQKYQSTTEETIPLADVVFRFPGINIELRAHKFILACKSEVFEVMFQSGMQESTAGVVVVEDVEPRVMKELLNYIYTDVVCMEAIKTLTLPLLHASIKYGITDIANQCEEELIKQLEKDNAIQMLRLADSYSASFLRKCALDLIMSCPQIVAQLVLDTHEETKPTTRERSAEQDNAI